MQIGNAVAANSNVKHSYAETYGKYTITANTAELVNCPGGNSNFLGQSTRAVTTAETCFSLMRSRVHRVFGVSKDQQTRRIGRRWKITNPRVLTVFYPSANLPFDAKVENSPFTRSRKEETPKNRTNSSGSFSLPENDTLQLGR